jgi:two-component system LytT family sensor kinase
MSLLLGILLGVLGAAVVVVSAAWRVLRRPRAEPAAEAMQSALHAATAMLPQLRRGLSARAAAHAAPYLRALTGAAAIAIADTRAVLAIDGEGREQVRPGDLLSRLLEHTQDDRIHVVPRLVSSDPACPLRSAAIAPLVVAGRRAGALIAFYGHPGRPHHRELRVIQEAAALVAAQVELSTIAEQEERLAQAELRALRAQISPHFTYNALAAIAGDITVRPEEARELLADFAEFTRYLFGDGRPYVALADELSHVERYLRLEQARFRDRLTVNIDVSPDARAAVVPALSLQPLVENAVRHGVERSGGSGRVEIRGWLENADVVVRVTDDGPGIDPERIPTLLAGGSGGIGIANVNARLRGTFGDAYALRLDSRPGKGTSAIMTVPGLRAGTPGGDGAAERTAGVATTSLAGGKAAVL